MDSPAVLQSPTTSATRTSAGSTKGKSKSSGKRKSVPKPRSKRANGSSVDSSVIDGDFAEAMGDDGTTEKFGAHKKQKELPKPAITIFMHHPFPFKNQEYLRKRAHPMEDDKAVYRPLKHIVGAEKQEWIEAPSHPAYWTIRAPPRLKPAKRYSDISGFEANYTDPETKLHYCNAEEFEIIRSLTRDLVQSYLRLRGYVDIIG